LCATRNHWMRTKWRVRACDSMQLMLTCTS
jgi:hypothetical protein